MINSIERSIVLKSNVVCRKLIVRDIEWFICFYLIPSFITTEVIWINWFLSWEYFFLKTDLEMGKLGRKTCNCSTRRWLLKSAEEEEELRGKTIKNKKDWAEFMKNKEKKTKLKTRNYFRFGIFSHNLGTHYHWNQQYSSRFGIIDRLNCFQNQMTSFTLSISVY